MVIFLRRKPVYCIIQKPHVHIKTDGIDVSALVFSKQVSCSADFHIFHCNFKAASKFRKITDYLKAFHCNVTQGFVSGIKQICIRLSVASSYASPKLVQLRYAVHICPVNDDCIYVRNVNSVFDDCSCNKNVEAAHFKAPENIVKFFACHLPVRSIYHHFRKQPFQLDACFCKRLNAVVQVKNLSAPLYFFSDCRRYSFIAVCVDDGFYRLAALRRRCQKAHIPDFQKAHMKRSRNWRCRHCKAVYIVLKDF